LDVMCSKAAHNIQFPVDLALFGETNGCLLVEVRASDRTAFEKYMAGAVFCQLGTVTAEPVLSIGSGDKTLVSLPVEKLVRAWDLK
jgi:hypothetical protein